MTQYCPRAIENGGGPDSTFKSPYNGEMHWREDGTCSYCGSLNPERLFQAIEEGVKITPTDKNYKIYVDVQVHGAGKFFFQHFSDEEAEKFCQLLNEGKLNLAVPGYFYARPYFMGFFDGKYFTKLSETDEIREHFAKKDGA